MLRDDVGYFGREAEAGEVDGARAGVVRASDVGVVEGADEEGGGEELADVVQERGNDGGVIASWRSVS